jgi:signal transduction histidine kinase
VSTRTTRPSGSPPTLTHRVRVLGIAAFVVGTLIASVGVRTFLLVLADRRDLVDLLDPAESVSRTYLTALIEQESAVRGYLLTGQEPFLESYASRRGAGERALADVRSLLGSFPSLLAAWERAGALALAWQRDSAEPAVAMRATRPERPAPDETIALSAARFNAFRASFDQFSGRLDAERLQALRALNRTTAELAGTLALGAVAVVVVGVVVRRDFRRFVVGPLERLGYDGQQVAAGDLAHPVEATGPEEIAQLGTIVERMRATIVADLEAVQAAQAALEEQAAELSRSNAELEQFAYVASHDLQEPLRKVASFCQMLERRYADQLDDRARQYISFAVDGVKRMQELINDLLAFSRVGHNRDPLAGVDCNVALERALDNLRVALDESGAVVTAEPLPTVRGDLSLLVALFQNLVENGIKFRRPDVPPAVVIRAQRVGDEWQLAVEDNGIGIDAAYAERVFVIFQRLHAREDYPGTGIGLALCRKIVEYHGGRIWVDVDPGGSGGTTVRWTLPAAEDPALEGFPHAATR